MEDRKVETAVGESSTAAQPAKRFRAPLWIVLAVFALLLVYSDFLSRIGAVTGFHLFIVAAAALAGAILIAALVIRLFAPSSSPHNETLTRELLDSAGPAILAIDSNRHIYYANPAAERLLGYRAAELIGPWGALPLIPPAEGSRLTAEVEKLSGIDRPAQPTAAARLGTFFECARLLPPSQMPSFNTQLLRKDGSLVPVALHISALRDAEGAIHGLTAIAIDRTQTLRQEQATRESQDRYRDLFESSSEMIATLSPAGRFLYANPAWKRCFGLDPAALLELPSFEDLFASGCGPEVSALFRRCLDGESVDRVPLRHHTADGRFLDLEVSLSQRQKAGNPLAIRCLLRDITQQKQHESRLALQLAVSRIVGDNSSSDQAAMRILEALCTSQGWDLAILWRIDARDARCEHLEFATAWAASPQSDEPVVRQSVGVLLARGSELPGRAWQEGRTVWLANLATVPASERTKCALAREMVSAWAVPVRVGNKVLAVLEFYSHFFLREDREATAAIEAVATSFGQMLDRSEEHGRAEKLSLRQEILLDSVAEGICGLDRLGAVSFVNPAAARMLGAGSAALARKSVHELLHGADPQQSHSAADCPLNHAVESQEISSGEDNIFRADGVSFPAEYVITPILDHGRFSGSVLNFRDVSQRYALDRLKDEFISTVSHELRTPLTSIRGALGLLTSGMLGAMSDKASHLLHIALTNSDRLVRLINDLLDLERIQSGREPLAFHPVQLNEIVRQAMEGMAPVADAAGVKLIHDSTQVQIAADSDRILQVLTNLLSNAVKFSPPNSTVSVMLRPGITGVTMSVIDHGRGIPADKLELVFGRFQQVDASDARQKGGSGLGLAICRTIVLQHSGRIWAERNPVRGSTFRVFLPYLPTPHEPEDDLAPEAGHGTILLAGAGDDVRPRITALLARHGYDVVETANVEDTLSAAHKGVQAILLDTSLDGMNGWQILPLLRKLDPEARTPVVLLSVDGPAVNIEHPLDVAGWVPKPVEDDSLLAELTRVFCGSGEKARILVVEDDHDLAGIIREVFASESIQVELAYTLQSAQEACSRFQPHLLVLDIGLPDGDGFNLVDWLRQYKSLAHLPLVVYSGSSFTPSERRQLTLGPTHFLTKTRVQPQQLEALVLTMLRTTRLPEPSPTAS
jgi:PAS domain S-box-containing protein